MTLSAKQKAVLVGMLTGLVITLLIVVPAAFLDTINVPADQELKSRLQVFCVSLVAPVCVLALSIARLAKHRFFDPIDIDGVERESKQAKILQALLQNTLEQTVLAVLVYIIYCIFVPINTLGAVLACSLLFLIGRVLFMIGYVNGAASRSIGFALTFYPSVLLLLLTAILSVII